MFRSPVGPPQTRSQTGANQQGGPAPPVPPTITLSPPRGTERAGPSTFPPPVTNEEKAVEAVRQSKSKVHNLLKYKKLNVPEIALAILDLDATFQKAQQMEVPTVIFDALELQVIGAIDKAFSYITPLDSSLQSISAIEAQRSRLTQEANESKTQKAPAKRPERASASSAPTDVLVETELSGASGTTGMEGAGQGTSQAANALTTPPREAQAAVTDLRTPPPAQQPAQGSEPAPATTQPETTRSERPTSRYFEYLHSRNTAPRGGVQNGTQNPRATPQNAPGSRQNTGNTNGQSSQPPRRKAERRARSNPNQGPSGNGQANNMHARAGNQWAPPYPPQAPPYNSMPPQAQPPHQAGYNPQATGYNPQPAPPTGTQYQGYQAGGPWRPHNQGNQHNSQWQPPPTSHYPQANTWQHSAPGGATSWQPSATGQAPQWQPPQGPGPNGPTFSGGFPGNGAAPSASMPPPGFPQAPQGYNPYQSSGPQPPPAGYGPTPPPPPPGYGPPPHYPSTGPGQATGGGWWQPNPPNNLPGMGNPLGGSTDPYGSAYGGPDNVSPWNNAFTGAQGPPQMPPPPYNSGGQGGYQAPSQGFPPMGGTNQGGHPYAPQGGNPYWQVRMNQDLGLMYRLPFPAAWRVPPPGHFSQQDRFMDANKAIERGLIKPFSGTVEGLSQILQQFLQYHPYSARACHSQGPGLGSIDRRRKNCEAL